MEKIALSLSGTNDYLIRHGDRYVLIDTGYEEDWELFQRQLAQHQVRLTALSHILLTHHHDDHAGLLNRIVRENPAIRIVMSQHAPDLLAKGENDRTHGGGMINAQVARLWGLKQWYLSFRLGRWVQKNNNLKFPPYLGRESDILVTRETRLKDLGLELDGVLFDTPGHSIDSLSILFDDGDCFVGDAAANFLQFAGTRYCVVFITDLDEYYRSWEKILSKCARHIFPAHGEPFPAVKLQDNLGKNRQEAMVLLTPGAR